MPPVSLTSNTDTMKTKSSKNGSKMAYVKLSDMLDVDQVAKKNGPRGSPVEQEEAIPLSAFEMRQRQRRQEEQEQRGEEQQNGNAGQQQNTSPQSPSARKRNKKKNKQAPPAVHGPTEEKNRLSQSPLTKKDKKNEALQEKQQMTLTNGPDTAENINPSPDAHSGMREKSKRQRKKRRLSIESGDNSNSVLIVERQVIVPVKAANKGAVIEQQSTSDGRQLKGAPNAKNAHGRKNSDKGTKELPLVIDDEELVDVPAKKAREGKKSHLSPGRDLLPKSHLPTGSNRDCFVVLAKADGDPLDFSTFPLSKSDDSTTNGRAALDWILQPFGVDRFFEKVWEKHALVLSRGNAKYHDSLFSTADFSELIRTSDLQYGRNINIAKYRNGERTTLNGQGRVHLKDVKRLIADGCSVQLINPQAFSDPIWYLCELLQEVFGSFVGANTYWTPAGSAGFASHWDEIDAFLLQLEGRKYWRLYAPEDKEESFPRESSGNFTPEQMANRQPVFEGWLEQGDLMHIPRGFIHVANTDADHHSLHVTVSVCRRVSFADLLDKLVPDLLNVVADEHVELRHSLPVNALNFAGVADADLKDEKFSAERKAFENSLRSMMNMVTDHVAKLADAGYDMMAREFFKTALPPKLTDEEQQLSAVSGQGDTLLKGKMPRMERGSLIRFIRRHGQRLIMESEDRCFIVHRMQNSRVYEGKDEQIVELPVDLADGFTHLTEQYPAWSKIADLPCASNDAKIDLAKILFSAGLILMR